jgi:hypothetical protein
MKQTLMFFFLRLHRLKPKRLLRPFRLRPSHRQIHDSHRSLTPTQTPTPRLKPNAIREIIPTSTPLLLLNARKRIANLKIAETSITLRLHLLRPLICGLKFKVNPATNRKSSIPIRMLLMGVADW